MWPRKRIDISWRDLFFGLWKSFCSDSLSEAQDDCQKVWSTTESSLVCLSVRSCFDLLLSELNWDHGSEVLISPITIPGMVSILEEHGLVPVPVDIDIETMVPSAESLTSAITSRTKAILIAHLFGAITDVDSIGEFAKEHGLLFFEDCAQAYVGNTYHGHTQADVSMFSFGPIKTATALGGGILWIRDEELCHKLQDRQNSYPVESRWTFLKRVGLYSLLKCLGNRRQFGLFVRLCDLIGLDYEKILGNAVRSFRGEQFFERIRKRPSAPLCRLLERRLQHFDKQRQTRRSELGRLLAEQLTGVVQIPARCTMAHAYWVFPILVEANRDEFVKALRRNGFDAHSSGQLRLVESQTFLLNAEDVTDSIVYLPLEPEMQNSDIERMTEVIRTQRQ